MCQKMSKMVVPKFVRDVIWTLDAPKKGRIVIAYHIQG